MNNFAVAFEDATAMTIRFRLTGQDVESVFLLAPPLHKAIGQFAVSELTLFII
jgi:hypothetical protein